MNCGTMRVQMFSQHASCTYDSPLHNCISCTFTILEMELLSPVLCGFIPLCSRGSCSAPWVFSPQVSSASQISLQAQNSYKSMKHFAEQWALGKWKS